MSLFVKIKNGVIMNAPSAVSRRMTKDRAESMIKCIRRLKIKTGETVMVDDQEMRMIKFENGIKLIGHPASKLERKVLGKVCEDLRLEDSYAKILIDGVTRYTYPHVGGAVLSMDIPIDKRYMFHPQQKNFLLEEQSIPEEARKKISEHFKPQPGWNCLDVGAFLGHGATWLREKIGPDGKIICVEANAHNRAVIGSQMKHNNFTNVDAKYAAIWHTSGETITFNLTSRQGNAIDNKVVNGSSKVDVETVSIDSLTKELGSAADFLSLTVNGAEVEAIEGMKYMNKKDLPKRIISPAWYPKDGVSRMKFIEPLYKELGYNYVATKGELTFAWLQDL